LTSGGAATDAQRARRDGLLAALLAYVMWGVFPVYFVFVASVATTEVLAHRVIWAVPFGALIVHFRRQWPEVRTAMSSGQTMFWLALAAIFISTNWLIYIWAAQHEQVLQASLGYYINPLMYVVVGVLFLKERLRRAQVVSLVLATIGVAYLTISGGQFPAIAISLALLFTSYGVIRKQVAVGAMPGLFVETLVLFPFALAWLGWLVLGGAAAFPSAGSSMSLLLVLAGPLTVLPLLFFAVGARLLTLSTVGFMQYIAPSLQFIVGISLGEQLTLPHIVCFGFIWTAIAVFSLDAVYNQRRDATVRDS
jgi:chloramphenicol-sensitive protein RarD